MGAVLCNTHGQQFGGPLCCEHVLAASYGRAPAGGASPDPHALTFVKIDLIEDGSVMMGAVMCGECAVRFGRVTGDVIAGGDFDEGKAPWVCPTCPPCFERWSGMKVVRK